MMSKLYVGNLPTDVSETALRQLFAEYGVTATNVLVKRGGYAFVDCDDQDTIDKAIEELNGKKSLAYKIPRVRSWGSLWHALPCCSLTYTQL